MKRTLLIAEVGPNHNGSLDTALDMIRRLAGSGADAVKFQLATPEAVYSKDAFKADYQQKNDGADSVIEMSRRIQLSRDDHKALHAACRDAGVTYSCTAFDLGSLRFLDETFDLPFFKVASGELLSVDMLDYMAGRDRPVILSTGMATFDEIDAALAVLDPAGTRDDITLLHCVSNYPAPAADINLNVIGALRERFARPVGYSDHSIGPECCLGAVALGAGVLEKHVTLDQSQAGPDHKASATVEEFTALAASVRTLEQALGAERKVFSDAENKIRSMARKSIVAMRDIAAGETVQRADLTFKRPGTGLAPIQLADVVGHTARRAIAADRVITRDDIEA